MLTHEERSERRKIRKKIKQNSQYNNLFSLTSPSSLIPPSPKIFLPTNVNKCLTTPSSSPLSLSSESSIGSDLGKIIKY